MDSTNKLDARVPVGLAVELGLAGYADHIETAFKVAPPVRLVDGGFGCLGVLMRDPMTDTVQCHVCGEWMKSLATHVHAHGMTAREYRKRYGLPREFPLCGRERSALMRKRALMRRGRGNWGNLEAARRAHRAWRAKPHPMKGKQLSLANSNKYGLCPEQLARRYEMVIEATGKDFPSVKDLRRIDPQLAGHLRRLQRTPRRPGARPIGQNLNDWRRENGFVVGRETPPRYEESVLLGALRKVAAEKNRRPRAGDFGYANGLPSTGAFVYAFGSWSRALKMAGFAPCWEKGGQAQKGRAVFIREMKVKKCTPEKRTSMRR